MAKLIRLFKPSTVGTPDEYQILVMDGVIVRRDEFGTHIEAARLSNGDELIIYPGNFPFIIENQ